MWSEATDGATHDPTTRTRARKGAPSLGLFLAEGPRAFAESLALRPSVPLLRRAPRGDGHPVLVLPGFTAGDSSTRVLRRYLRRLGYGAHPWLQGRNLGPREELRDQLFDRVDGLQQRYGRKLSLVGWSLGGIYAREIAKRMPDHVRQVVTLGSPFAAAGRPTNASALYDLLFDGARQERAAAADELRRPPPAPSTAIYTRTDGVVHWSSCLEPEADHTENIEVPGSHCGLGFNSLVLYAVADRLSQPEGEWRRFERSGWRRLAYR
jgi:pimeloyl-ACP methyl ester carboxylesterase